MQEFADGVVADVNAPAGSGGFIATDNADHIAGV
jgi:hypothetical protein